ncbi:hypothetical protein IT397_02650 [Candidatus Nomurabacteria bacterium]|nr:hypothetical protein [Candidatus Nomurabacteria bacterium]
MNSKTGKDLDKGESLFSWEAYEYKDRDLKNDWYWAVGIIALAGSVTAFILNNFLFGIFIIFATIAIFFFSRIKPKLTTYEITTEGIVYEDNFFTFDHLKCFWMDETENDNKKLLIKSERNIASILVLPYDKEEDGDQIFAILSEILPDEPLREPWGHLIMERLGF